jgi:hypothetical protein
MDTKDSIIHDLRAMVKNYQMQADGLNESLTDCRCTLRQQAQEGAEERNVLKERIRILESSPPLALCSHQGNLYRALGDKVEIVGSKPVDLPGTVVWRGDA